MDGVGASKAGACGVKSEVRETKGVREHGRALQASGGLAGEAQSGFERSHAQNAGGNDAEGADREGAGREQLAREVAEETEGVRTVREFVADGAASSRAV